jgi:hypothetical protein
MLNELHKPFPIMVTLIAVTANLLGCLPARGAETPSTLQSDSVGWVDILPPADLKAGIGYPCLPPANWAGNSGMWMPRRRF